MTMEQEITNRQILDELKQLRIDIDIIKNDLNNEDSQLTEEEGKLLEESYEAENDNKLTSSEDLKKELGI